MHDTRIPLPMQQPNPDGPAGSTQAQSLQRILPTWTAPGSPISSLYLHVPFCFHKCHYCDFYSIVDNRDRQAAFARRLIRELHALARLPEIGQVPSHTSAAHPMRIEPMRTIFVGGGTPTLLKAELWKDVLRALGLAFDMNDIHAGDGEFTVEANPETVTHELLDILSEGGVNRISIGAQSFNETHLKTLERWHDPANVAKAVTLGHNAGIHRQSIDLIFAIPGQTLDDWHDDLVRAIELGIEHVSCYNLTYEPNTAMTKRLSRGDFTPTDESIEVEMQLLAVELLKAHGIERYEVSNFAKPGQECAHNLMYWRNENWLAAGPSAAGHINGFRYKNAPRLDTYLSAIDDTDFAPVQEYEHPDAVRTLSDTILGRIRLREGVPIDVIEQQAGHVDILHESQSQHCMDRLTTVAVQCKSEGWLDMSSERWKLTTDGFLFADRVARDLICTISP